MRFQIDLLAQIHNQRLIACVRKPHGHCRLQWIERPPFPEESTFARESYPVSRPGGWETTHLQQVSTGHAFFNIVTSMAQFGRDSIREPIIFSVAEHDILVRDDKGDQMVEMTLYAIVT